MHRNPPPPPNPLCLLPPSLPALSPAASLPRLAAKRSRVGPCRSTPPVHSAACCEGKSVAILIYADQATTHEYPAARGRNLRPSFPPSSAKSSTSKLLDYHEVMNWQDETTNWVRHDRKTEIGKHFFRRPRPLRRTPSIIPSPPTRLRRYPGPHPDARQLQGLRSRIPPPSTPPGPPSWMFPTPRLTAPPTPPRPPPDALRASLLEKFADKLTNCFYDHHEFDEAVPDESNH